MADTWVEWGSVVVGFFFFFVCVGVGGSGKIPLKLICFTAKFNVSDKIKIRYFT